MTNITIDKFQFKRGNEANVPSLDSGEPFISEDSHILFVGTPAGNIEFAKKSDVDANTASLAEKLPYKAVEEFGAFGDGTTDDSTAISNALNSNYNIVFGQKTYYIGSQVTVTVGNKILQGNGATILYKGSESSSAPNGGIVKFSNVNNVSISDLTVNVNTSWITRPYSWDTTNYNSYIASRTNIRDGISFTGCNGIRLSKVTSTKGRTGFYVENSTKVCLTDCRAEYTWADGYFITGSSNHVSIEGCHCDNVGDDNFSCDGYDAVTATNNPHNVVISNCTSVDSFGALISLVGSNNTKAIGCTGANNKYVPFKLGRLNNAGNIVCGFNQYIIGCDVVCNDTIEGNANSGLPSKSGQIMEGFSTAYQANNHDLYIINSSIQKSDTQYFELYFEYCSNIAVINTTITGFNLIPNFTTNMKVHGNNLYLQGSFTPSNSTYLTVMNNYISNKAISTTRGTNVMNIVDCSNVKATNNAYVNSNTGSQHDVDIITSQAQTSIEIDNDNVGCTATNVTNLGQKGVFINSHSIAAGLFKNGQVVYNTVTSTLSVVKSGTLTTIV